MIEQAGWWIGKVFFLQEVPKENWALAGVLGNERKDT